MAHDPSHDSHDHSDEALPSYDDINTPVVVMVGVISGLLTLLSMMFVQGLYYHWDERIRNSAEVVKTETAEQIDNQKALLKGGGAIKSIDDAMQSVVSKFGK
jgi:hypothetical protein